MVAVSSVLRMLMWGVVAIFVSVVGKAVYNVYFHPLRHYPGPKLWAASRLPWIWTAISGEIHNKISDLHQTYGPVVRTAPNELSYISDNAWKQIYGHRPVEMPKDLKGPGLLPTFKNTESIVTASSGNHPRMRRLISHAFSEKAIREQEDLVQNFIDQMISRLTDKCKEGPQDVTSWFNWCTFDITGDLAFGEPFGCLQETQYHEWVKQIFQGVKVYPWMQAIVYYGLLPVAKLLAPKEQQRAKEEADAKAYAKLDRRIARKDQIQRKDFMNYILRENKQGSAGMTMPEIQETAVILIIAGSETTATLLSGLLYFVLRHQSVYRRMVREVRSTFTSYENITMVTTNELKYMPVVVEEAFRLYPPSPNAFPRLVPGKGEAIEGRWVAGGMTVGVHPFAASRHPDNFYRPLDFLPERWLAPHLMEKDDVPAEMFARDKKNVSQPFSFGPRNCIGKSLAYAEIRVILSKLLWTFDLALAPESDNDDWARTQKTYMLWEKPALMVNLTPVK
ncbi:hypothetical protein Z517_11184 [Fonsecaea pedrosoi CBS 271.37]|uniref:Cytochrome P450 monooxygenase n=1 Tax=Fonsecaea pedrosoi CBS 271.37 TaxID=1442368 RepID=A0A0D2G726_9EURO|nr:uncharacterized protein Z517_11184 [Fonsecaea pedrosoi CBS 271.37]KIW76438.1 hypothetical protein Z517_11184 [Fonsecaea pedrosoi CBS 271.37]